MTSRLLPVMPSAVPTDLDTYENTAMDAVQFLENGEEDLGPIPAGGAWQHVWNDLCIALEQDQKALLEDSPYRVHAWEVYLSSKGRARLPKMERLTMLSFVRELHVQYDQEQGARNAPRFEPCDRSREVRPPYRLLQELAVKGNVRTLALLVEHAVALELDIVGQPRHPHENLLCAFAFEAARDAGNPICSGAQTGVSQGVAMCTEGGRAPGIGDTVTMTSQDFHRLRPVDHPWTRRWASFGVEGAASQEQLNDFIDAGIRFMRALHARFADIVAAAPAESKEEKLRQAAELVGIKFPSEQRRAEYVNAMVKDGTLWTVLMNPGRMEETANSIMQACVKAKQRVIRSLALEFRELVGPLAGGRRLAQPLGRRLGEPIQEGGSANTNLISRGTSGVPSSGGGSPRRLTNQWNSQSLDKPAALDDNVGGGGSVSSADAGRSASSTEPYEATSARLECTICMEKPPNWVFKTCMHQCVCKKMQGVVEEKREA